MFPVVFMFLSFGNMLLCLAAALFIPQASAYALCAMLYAAMVATEYRYGIRSPISISLLVLYSGLLLLEFNAAPFRQYVGLIVFAWLSLLTGTLLLGKKPFTTFYSKGRGMRQLHYTVSALWCMTYFLCLLCHALRFPSASFLVTPYLLCIACGLCTIFLHLCWFGKRNSLQPAFSIGDYAFRRICVGSADFDRFCRFYARQIDTRGEGGSAAEVAEAVAKMERELGPHAYIFVAEREGQVVGCIRCIVDRKHRPFPMEEDMGLCFDHLRGFGNLLYVGRLAVDPDFRDRPDVLNGLFKCFVDLALSKDISFVVAEGLPARLPVYRKLGFEPMFPSADPRHSIRMSLGYECHPIYLNFARMVFSQSAESARKYGFSAFVNAYLAERWYKRNALSHILKPPGRWPWRLDLARIRTTL
ncbi:hypothetical protein CAL29_17110 [Bordetella genomosp. 10]|uniref:N-acetyltransferase domain-containing protein n=1 Tax=Bordetella genomosp. 10 TaxID=1416804 RepID=A0A261RYI2_9BORD|nr:hypothetical protein CAL29_17110 [Bordetella genomosp. 10]